MPQSVHEFIGKGKYYLSVFLDLRSPDALGSTCGKIKNGRLVVRKTYVDRRQSDPQRFEGMNQWEAPSKIK
jgi:hypothetical protein